jgi:F-type H+-transporting ATPase subunit b
MDKLLQPDTGLMVWTVVTFLALVFILAKFAWKPILDGINQREQKIRGDIERAEKSQSEAEQLRRDYETQLAQAQKTVQDLVAQARQDAEKARGELVAAAKSESEKILEKGRKDLANETDRLRSQLRSEVADLSLSVAEKILGRSVDKKIQDEILKDSLKSVGGVKLS